MGDEASAARVDIVVDGEVMKQHTIDGKTYVEIPGKGGPFAIHVFCPKNPEELGFRLNVDGITPPYWYRASAHKVINTFPINAQIDRKLVFGAPNAGTSSSWSDHRSADGPTGIGCINVCVYRVQECKPYWHTAGTYDYTMTERLVAPRLDQCGDATGGMLKTTAQLGEQVASANRRGQTVSTKCPASNPVKEFRLYYRSKAQIEGIPTEKVKPEVEPKVKPEVKSEAEPNAARKRVRVGDSQDLAIVL